MKLLKVNLDINRHSTAYAFWSGNGKSTLPSDEPVLSNVNVFQNIPAKDYPSPWFVKTRNIDCEAIMLCNASYYDMQVTVNGTLYKVQGRDTVVVPANVVISKAFVDLCHNYAVYNLNDISKVSINLSRLTWSTGVNAYMELV